MAGTTQYFGISYPTATDYVKDGASNMQTIATGFDTAVAIPTYNNQTGTTYTFVLADAAKTVTSNNASAVTFTIPPQSSVAWATGTTLTIKNYGAGAITFAGGSGVTVTNTATTVPQYGEASLVRTGSDAWTVIASVAASPGLTLINSTTFTSQATVNLNSVFSSTYDNYKIFMSVTTGSSSGTITARLRVSGTDATTNYENFGFRSVSNTLSNYQNLTSNWVISANTNATTQYPVFMELINPALAKYTFVTSTSFTDLYGSMVIQGDNYNATAYDGISFIRSAGDMTGVVRVYGYKNS